MERKVRRLGTSRLSPNFVSPNFGWGEKFVELSNGPFDNRGIPVRWELPVDPRLVRALIPGGSQIAHDSTQLCEAVVRMLIIQLHATKSDRVK